MNYMVNKQIQEFKNLLYNDLMNKYCLIEDYLYLNIFIYDEDSSVRSKVVYKNYNIKQLQYDKKFFVRYHVANYTKDKSILEYLSNDIITRVRYRAEERLNELYGK